MCYQVQSSAQIDWATAESICTNSGSGGHLASIHSPALNVFLNHMAIVAGLSGSAVWIGLLNDDTIETWQWSDRTPLDYTNWASGHPTSGHKVCTCIFSCLG